MTGYMTNFPFGINTANSTLQEGEGNILCNNITVNDSIKLPPLLTLNGDVEATGLILFSNAGGMGFISNGQTSTAYNGIAADSNGIYLTDGAFSITSNGGSGVVYSSILDLTTTGDLTLEGSITSNSDIVAAGTFTANATSTAVGLLLSSSGLKSGLVYNATDSTYNGIAAGDNGIFLSSGNFTINKNGGSGSSYTIALSISNSSSGGVDILGSSDGNTSPTGYVGEVETATRDEDSSISVSNNTYTDITSTSLTKGNWLISGCIGYICTSVSSADFNSQAGMSIVSGNVNPNFILGLNSSAYHVTTGGTDLGTVSVIVPPFPYSITSTTTFYLKGWATFSGSLNAYGGIVAIRLP